MSTKGKQIQIGYVDRFSRETLEKRLEKTPSNARCFAQGSSLMCWSILESLMGIAHGAEELRSCPHGLASQAGAWGHNIGLCLGYGHIWNQYYGLNLEKYSARPITLSHDQILTTKRFVASEAWDAGDADRGIARVNRATRARYWHILTFPIFSSLPSGPILANVTIVLPFAFWHAWQAHPSSG